MLEPIDRQAALAEIDDTIAGSLQRSEDVYIDKGLMMARRLIEKLPTIDPEVRHGEWIPAKSTISSKCSACGKYSPSESPFCPRCGADMRGWGCTKMPKVDCDAYQCEYNDEGCCNAYKIELDGNGVCVSITTVIKEADEDVTD